MPNMPTITIDDAVLANYARDKYAQGYSARQITNQLEYADITYEQVCGCLGIDAADDSRATRVIGNVVVMGDDAEAIAAGIRERLVAGGWSVANDEATRTVARNIEQHLFGAPAAATDD